LATRDDFARRRAAAAALRPGHPGLLTVAVGARTGDFLVGDYSGRSTRCDASAFAAVLAALPLYGSDLRMWLSWPDGAEDRQRLRANLTDLAEVTGATVWAPAEGERVGILDGCSDLSVVDSQGQPGRWFSYGGGGFRRFASDVDGRLVPAGGVVRSGYPGVPLVSVSPDREQEMSTRYERLRPRQSLLRADLAVLADGRLAVRYQDGSLLAVGGRQLRRLLDGPGWSGVDLVLLSAVAPERTAGAHRHAARLAEELGCGITFGERPEPAPVPPSAAPAARSVVAGGEPVRYSRPAVAHALSSLDPGEPAQAAILTALAEAVADHVSALRRPHDDVRQAETARAIDALAGAASP
jgi:hypothetical protein